MLDDTILIFVLSSHFVICGQRYDLLSDALTSSALVPPCYKNMRNIIHSVQGRRVVNMKSSQAFVRYLGQDYRYEAVTTEISHIEGLTPIRPVRECTRDRCLRGCNSAPQRRTCEHVLNIITHSFHKRS